MFLTLLLVTFVASFMVALVVSDGFLKSIERSLKPCKVSLGYCLFSLFSPSSHT